MESDSIPGASDAMIDKTHPQSGLASDRTVGREDKLGVARWAAITLLFFCLTGLGAVGVHRMIRTAKTLPDVLKRQKAIGLSTPAWVPSGRPLRIPSGLRRGVDLRFVPQLPADGPGAIGKSAASRRPEAKK